MRAFAAMCCLLVAASASAAGDPPDVSALRKLKLEDWPRAYREQDTVLLDRLLAPEFQSIDADGVVTTKADELAWIGANPPGYQRFRYRIERLDVFDNGTAIVAGTGTIDGRDANGAWRATYRSSNVLLRRDGRWVAVASHVSGVQRVRLDAHEHGTAGAHGLRRRRGPRCGDHRAEHDGVDVDGLR